MRRRPPEEESIGLAGTLDGTSAPPPPSKDALRFNSFGLGERILSIKESSDDTEGSFRPSFLGAAAAAVEGVEAVLIVRPVGAAMLNWVASPERLARDVRRELDVT